MAMQERASRADYGFGAPINLIGESAPSSAPLMQFIRAGWANPSAEKRSDLQAVSYRLTDGQLVRAVWLRPDATSTTPVSNRVLLDNVVRVEMRFMRGGQSSREWNVSRRTTLDILPELIEMIIVFADGNTLTIAALTGARQ